MNWFLIQPVFIQPIVIGMTLVAPFVVLLDNHTTNRKGKVNPMAGSGNISQIIAGMDIMRIILSWETLILGCSLFTFCIVGVFTPVH